MNINKKLIAVAVAGLLSTPVWAADTAASPGTQNAKFSRLDTNHDGKLSRAEVRSMANYDSAFAQADEDKNGMLSQDEFIKAEAIYDRERAEGFVEDSVITTRVKDSMVKEFRNLKVSVETYRGNVLLSGFVDNEAQVQKAVQIASAVKGVHSVKNGLAIK